MDVNQDPYNNLIIKHGWNQIVNEKVNNDENRNYTNDKRNN